MRPWAAIAQILVLLVAVCLSVLFPSQVGTLANPQEKIADLTPVWFLVPFGVFARIIPVWAVPVIFVLWFAISGGIVWMLGSRARSVSQSDEAASVPFNQSSQGL